MKEDEKIEDLDCRLNEIDRSSSRKIKRLNDYEPYIVTAIAFAFILTGLVSGAFLNEQASPAGFVVIDLNTGSVSGAECAESWQCSEWSGCGLMGHQSRYCFDANECRTRLNAPSESAECEIDILHLPVITGFAVVPETQQKDILAGALYMLAALCVFIIAVYIAMLYFTGSAMDTYWLAFAYWIAMAGVPLSIYYAATRGAHIYGVYSAFGISAVTLVVLTIIKPWKAPVLPELNGINRMLQRSSAELSEDVRLIKHAREKRISSFAKFVDRIKKNMDKRDLLAEGVKDFNVARLNRSIERLRRGPLTSERMKEVEESIKEREDNFRKMNEQLAKWADERRKQREVIEKMRKDLEEARMAQESPKQ